MHPTIAAGRFAAVETELSHRARHIIVISGAKTMIPKWTESIRTDSLFRVQDSTDLKLMLQTIQAKPVPTICLWIGPEPPHGVFQYFQKFLFVSLLVTAPMAPMEEYDAVFWPPEVGVEEAESILIRKMGSVKAGAVAVGMILKELRASNVGLVWSSIEESDKSGGVYWFDPLEFEIGGVETSVSNLFEQLRYVTDQLQKVVGR